jgi:hypothetical protein
MSLFIQCILCQSVFLLSVYLGMRLKRDGYINLMHCLTGFLFIL